MLAMHNYHDTYGHFPADAVDKDGKPLLKLRVQLLPFLEEENLYKQFNQNESWDSEQNLKLLARMPSVFRVGFEPKDATHTYYQRFTYASANMGHTRFEGVGGGSGTSGPPSGSATCAPGAPSMPMGAGSPAGSGALPPGAEAFRNGQPTWRDFRFE